MGLTQTGMYLNEQPQVELNLWSRSRDDRPTPATHKSFVPLILLGRLTSGAPLVRQGRSSEPTEDRVDWQSSGAIASPGMAMSQMQPSMGQAMMQPMGQPMMNTQPMPGAASHAERIP